MRNNSVLIANFILLISFMVILNLSALLSTTQIMRNNFKTLADERYQDIGKIQADIFAVQNAVSSVKNAISISDTKTVTVTAYTPSVSECDSDPYITASMQRIRPGTVAVSRDLFRLGWSFGKKVYIEGVGVLTISDLMNKRWENRIDIVMFDRSAAFKFGKQKAVAVLLRS